MGLGEIPFLQKKKMFSHARSHLIFFILSSRHKPSMSTMNSDSLSSSPREIPAAMTPGYILGVSALFSSGKIYALSFQHIQALAPTTWSWKSRCLSKLKAFAWLLFNNRLNTRNMLQRLHIQVTEVTDCVLCDSEEPATRGHLFWKCAFMLELHWNFHWPF